MVILGLVSLSGPHNSTFVLPRLIFDSEVWLNLSTKSTVDWTDHISCTHTAGQILHHTHRLLYHQHNLWPEFQSSPGPMKPLMSGQFLTAPSTVSILSVYSMCVPVSSVPVVVTREHSHLQSFSARQVSCYVVCVLGEGRGLLERFFQHKH